MNDALKSPLTGGLAQPRRLLLGRDANGEWRMRRSDVAAARSLFLAHEVCDATLAVALAREIQPGLPILVVSPEEFAS